MLFGIPSYISTLLTGSFITWVFLTTILPQSITKYSHPNVRSSKFDKDTFPYESLTPYESITIRNSSVYYIIGHPDDEVMFFSPSILELGKPVYNNEIKLICFSVGDAVDETYGPIRSSELAQSARILGIKPENLVVLDSFKDGMDVQWDHTDISTVLKRHIKEPNATIITFDEEGVSNHPNHISLFHGCKKFFTEAKGPVAMYKLKSLNFLEKYSFTVLTNIELFFEQISKLILRNTLKFDINISFFTIKESSSIKIYSDLNMLSVSYGAMAYGHFSQMVWFRYGWLVFSRYLTFNNLIRV